MICTPVSKKQLDENGEPTPTQPVKESHQSALKQESNNFSDPCPISNTFSRKTLTAIERGAIDGNVKTRLLRKAAIFYYSLCNSTFSTPNYVTIVKTLCAQYPQLKDKRPVNGDYWVSINVFIFLH